MRLRLCVFALMCVMAPTAFAEDWPGWLGPRRDGSSIEKVPAWKEPIKILWKKPVGEAHSSPIVAGGKVYVHVKGPGKAVERIASFDAVTGEPDWTKDYEHAPFVALYGNGPRATPCVVGGKLYSFGITGILSCVDAKTGDIAWQVDTLKEFGAKNLLFGMSGSPLVADGLVFLNVGGKGTSLVALDKDTGKTVWKSLDDPASYSSPILVNRGDQKQLVFLTGANVVAVEPKTGKKIWEFPFKDALFESSTTPVTMGDMLFASSITVGGAGLKYHGSDAEKAWFEPKLTCYFSTPVAAGDHLFLVTGTKPSFPPKGSKAALWCVDPVTGKELWKRDNVGKYHASLLRTGDGKLLLVEEAGNLVLLDADPKEYRELCRSKICGTTWAHPAVADGRLYIRDNRELVCVELPK